MTQNPQVTTPAHTDLTTPRRGVSRGPVSTQSRTTLTEQQRSVALTWVGRGFSVVPCSKTDKAALVRGFGREALPEELAQFGDPETVRSWWSGRYRRDHVGLLTGRGADGRGLVVVDCDMPKADAEPLTGRWAGCHGGTDVLELLAGEAGASWPDTYTVVTPSGGLHLYYRQPENGPIIGCATGAGGNVQRPQPPHLGPMVDVRGIGGYVIAAGSYSRAQGRPYERVSAPDMLPQPLPGWLLELLRPAAPPAAPPRPPAPVRALPTSSRTDRYAAATLQQLADQVAAARDGERWSSLSGAALRLAELAHTAPQVLAYDVVLETLTAAAAASGMSGGYRRAERAVRTAWERKAIGGAA